MMQLIRLPIHSSVAAFLLVGLLLGTLHAGDIPGGNLIQNPSFEVRSGPRQDYPAEPWGYGPFDTISRSPWAHWGYSGFFDGDYDIKLGPGHTGAMCARLVCRQRGRGGLCTDAIRVKTGAKLRFHGFFKGIGAKGTCFINFEGDPGDGWAAINLPSASDYDWTEITGEVTVKEPQPDHKVGPDGMISIYVFIYTRAYGELWIDDVTLTNTDSKQP